MDQRVKGGTPPSTNSNLDPTSVPEVSELEQVAEKWGEEGDAGRIEEEKRGTGRKRDGDKGAVLELLIEGRCGNTGQQQLQISGRETSCPEGNVRLRIGLQAKRTKKPPKILESYVCKPTIRTYQRQGKGGLLRADGEAGVGKISSSPNQATTDQRSPLAAVQTTSKQAASAAPPAPVASQKSSATPSLSSQPVSLTSTFAAASAPASLPAITCQGIKSSKQVPAKVSDKTNVDSNGSSERVKKETFPSVNGQCVPIGQKPSSPTASHTTSTTPSTPTIQAPETSIKEKISKKQNDVIETKNQKGILNGKGSVAILGTSTSSKIKIGKHSSSSSVSFEESLTKPLDSSSSHKELGQSSKTRPDSPSAPSVTSKLQSSPTVHLSSTQSQDQIPFPQPSPEKKRGKERKIKKDKLKNKKLKRDRVEVEGANNSHRNEEGKKKKKDKGKEGKSRHGKEKDERHVTDNAWGDDLKTGRGKTEKRRDKFSPERQKTKINNGKCDETIEIGELDNSCEVVTLNRLEEINKTDDGCKPVKQADPATGENNKSTEQDVTRHSAVPQSHAPFSAPPSVPSPPARPSVSPPCSPQEQDSRPLKKRKARRPSWTKLVHRAQRAESQEASSDSHHNTSFPLNSKTSFPSKATFQPADESHHVPSSSLTSSSSATKPASPQQSRFPVNPSPPPSRYTIAPVRKRGRPKSQSSLLNEPPPRLSPNRTETDLPLLRCDRIQKAPVLEPSPIFQCAAQPKSSPKKRGRPPKRPHSQTQSGDALNYVNDRGRNRDSQGDRQMKIKRVINEIHRRKKRKLQKVMFSGYIGLQRRGGRAEDAGTSVSMCKSIGSTTVHALSALSSSFGSKLGPQINVSKRGTIYMGKRRGRKPKSQTTSKIQSNSQNSAQSSLFSSLSETSLFSNQLQPPPSHPFPSPSLTHSSGAQSPYSEGSLAEPTASLLFPHPFSLPSPSSSCTSPRPPSSSSLSPFVKKSCPCQGRHHFPFHQSSCKLSCPTPPLHHTPGSPSQLKEATPSPRSESHSEETLPSDSGIGTDNNSVSERGEVRGPRGILRLVQGSGVILKGQRIPPSVVDRSSPASSPLSHMPRHTNPIINSPAVDRHRDRHRHRWKDYDCSSSCTCLCPCPGHKCTHSGYYPCLGHNAFKRQKNKHKKKHQQMHMQDPEFLAEIEDLIGQFSEVRIGRQGWTRTGLGQGFDGSGNAGGGKRLHTSHSPRSNVFRINLNGFYSPHPSPYSTNSPFNTQPFYPCQAVQCNRKLDRRQCGCPSKFQETIENIGLYNSYPPATTLYHHLPSTYTLPSSHQYSPHQPHHAHFLLNPARFHRRRSRLLREGTLGGEVEGNLGGGGGGVSGGGLHLSSGYASSLSCSCGRSDHKHKHKHRHRHCDQDVDDEEELHEDGEDNGMEREALGSSKARSGFLLAQGEGRIRGARQLGTALSKESPWLCENGKDSFSSSAAATSLSYTAERYKCTSLTSVGLGSSHLSSFGGGWGGLDQGWTKFRGLGGTGFGKSKSSWRGFTEEQQTNRLVASDGEDEDDEGVEDSHPYRTSTSPKHTNLFTSAAMTAGGWGLRSRLVGRNPQSGDRSWRRDEPAWTERRESGLQGDSRSLGKQKILLTPDSGAGHKKRGPGRPRKHPLPSTVSSALHSSTAPSMSSFELLPGHSHDRDGRDLGGRQDASGPARDRGGNAVEQVTELKLQARRKRGRKRKHGDSPCHQSVTEDKDEYDEPPECFGQSDADEAPSQPVAIQTEERAYGPPRKNFLTAGLYSDDYKTTDPPSTSQQPYRDSMEYTPDEHQYSILPAPIHVGKYLRLKRIHFQLPYDVMWLWQHNQLQRQPSVPLKRKRHYFRLKERTVSSHQRAEESSSDITSLFPHLDMEPLTSSERDFVVKHRVFLVRNWELVRDRQIRLRVERERNAEGEETDSQQLPFDGGEEDDGHIKSDQPVGVEVTVISSDLQHQNQDTSSSPTASPTKTQNRQEEDREEEKRGEEEVCNREQRRKRLNDLLLTLQHL